MKSVSIPKDVAGKFINWLMEKYSKGIHGDPTSWQVHLK
jgi:hypothetical protein